MDCSLYKFIQKNLCLQMKNLTLLPFKGFTLGDDSLKKIKQFVSSFESTSRLK